MIRNMMSLIAACGLITVCAGSAQAWFKVCNKTNSSVWVSYGDQATCGFFSSCNDGCNGTYDVHQRGWYKISANSCTTLNGDEADQYRHWVYAENGKGTWWGAQNMRFRLPYTAYDTCCDPNGTYCTPRETTTNTRTKWHLRVGTSKSNYTLNLLP